MQDRNKSASVLRIGVRVVFTLSADAIANPARYLLAGAWLGWVLSQSGDEKWQSASRERVRFLCNEI